MKRLFSFFLGLFCCLCAFSSFFPCNAAVKNAKAPTGSVCHSVRRSGWGHRVCFVSTEGDLMTYWEILFSSDSFTPILVRSHSVSQ